MRSTQTPRPETREVAVSQVTDKIYNSYLQTVGVESGRQSYGEVVDLLTAWYFSQEATQ